LDKITDRISEISNSIKERLSNPFIFSFILSWLLWNWKITVGLLWYDYYQLKADGYDTYFKLISTEVGKDGSFCYPFWVSIGITLAAPVLKTGFHLFNAFIIKNGNKAYFEITGKASVSAEKYFEAKQEADRLHNRMSNAITNEGKFKQKYEDEVVRNKQLSESHKVETAMTESAFLNGRWELHHTQPTRGDKYIFNFIGGSINSHKSGNPGDSSSWSLGFFFRDIRPTERMAFQIVNSQNGSSQFYSLSKESEAAYVGTEISGNNSSQVSFIKIAK